MAEPVSAATDATIAPGAARDPVFDRPAFIVSSPRSGSTLLFETLMRAPPVHTIGSESHGLIETIPGLDIQSRGYSSNRLDAAAAMPEVVVELRRRFRERMRDRNGNLPQAMPLRMLEKTPKNSLRIPFLLQAFPEARFVFLYRDPRQVLASMIEAWLSGRFQTYRGMLPGWPLPYWSLLLTPDWQGLIGKPLPQIVAAQWQATMETLVDDLERLPPGRCQVVRYDGFVADPAAVIAGLCRFLDYSWDQPLRRTLPLARHTLTLPNPEKWRKHAAVIEPLLPQLRATIERVERFADT